MERKRENPEFKAVKRERFERTVSLPPVSHLLEKNKPIFWDAGCGHGEFIAAMAGRNSHNIYFATEIKRCRAEETRSLIARNFLDNAYVFRFETGSLIRVLPDECLDGAYINHPDPWPKNRHHKNRLLDFETTCEFSRVLKRGGFFHYATDYKHYADETLKILESIKTLENESKDGGFVMPQAGRPTTVYERKALEKGQNVYFLRFVKRL